MMKAGRWEPQGTGTEFTLAYGILLPWEWLLPASGAAHTDVVSAEGSVSCRCSAREDSL